MIIDYEKYCLDLSSSCGMSTFTFVVLKCCFNRKELTKNPMRENAESNVQNTWKDPMLSLSQKWCDRNTEREPHPLKTEQYQLRFALSLEDNARSARRARWFKSIIVRKPSYKHRHKTNWIDGCIQWNQMLRNESVKRGPYFIKALKRFLIISDWLRPDWFFPRALWSLNQPNRGSFNEFHTKKIVLGRTKGKQNKG